MSLNHGKTHASSGLRCSTWPLMLLVRLLVSLLCRSISTPSASPLPRLRKNEDCVLIYLVIDRIMDPARDTARCWLCGSRDPEGALFTAEDSQVAPLPMAAANPDTVLLMRFDVFGGALPITEAWEEVRSTGSLMSESLSVSESQLARITQR